jgi:hypothetical protein
MTCPRPPTLTGHRIQELHAICVAAHILLSRTRKVSLHRNVTLSSCLGTFFPSSQTVGCQSHVNLWDFAVSKNTSRSHFPSIVLCRGNHVWIKREISAGQNPWTLTSRGRSTPCFSDFSSRMFASDATAKSIVFDRHSHI